MRLNRLTGAVTAAIASGLLVAGLNPASAESRPEQGRTAERSADTQAAAKPRASAKLYCVVDNITGTRIPQKVCKTKAEWSNQGVEIDA
ncbi:hypothetical protein [Sphingomonas sp.]|uniref:hypothetical protein n=1 Tax=Sphingomonas sp. TaxID=28214 RepID=UPI001DB32EBA|nr:hypothetical protein [Sphingomonas sp.]MBX9797179.1 hypothetical protein [Sphingomonas sp.]